MRIVNPVFDSFFSHLLGDLALLLCVVAGMWASSARVSGRAYRVLFLHCTQRSVENGLRLRGRPPVTMTHCRHVRVTTLPGSYVPKEYNVTEVQIDPENVENHLWKEHTAVGNEVCHLSGLQMKDLRFLDPIGRSGILLRESAPQVTDMDASVPLPDASAVASVHTKTPDLVIVTFPRLKVIVTSNRALVFETRIPLVQRLHRLLDPGYPPPSIASGCVPFGLAVFENSLNMVYRDLRNQVILLSKMMELISKRLNDLNDTGSATTLSSMLSVRKIGLELQAHLQDIIKTTNDVLRADDDLDGMARVLTNDPNATHDELEIMLEEHARCVSGAAAQLDLALDSMDMSKQFYRIRISDVRNTLLRTSLNISIGAVAVGSGALVAGIFGQNLTSGLEDHPELFYYVSGGILSWYVVGDCESIALDPVTDFGFFTAIFVSHAF